MRRCLAASDRGSRLEGAVACYDVAPHNRVAYDLAREWLGRAAKPNLLIVGPIGCGKSWLASVLFTALAERGQAVMWVSVPRLLEALKRGFSRADIRARTDERYELAKAAPILILDDIGKAHPGRSVSWVEEQLYGIVDARYSEELPTVVTTEWRSAALADRVGESVVSRLLHGAIVASIRRPAKAYRERLAP